MIEFNETELRVHFETKSQHLLGNTPPSECYEQMIELINKRNYLQIIYNFGYRYLLVIMDFFEEREDYGKCSIILSTIHNYNKVSGNNINTQLCEEL